MHEIVDRINNIIDKISDSDIEKMVNVIKAKGNENRIFVIGVGRSGLVARMFAMRLVHLGLTVYVVGEIVTPAVKKEDLIIAVSGSGGTKSIITTMKIAKDIGAEILSVTSNPESEMGLLSDIVVDLRVKRGAIFDVKKDYFADQIRGDYVTKTYTKEELMPLGTLFEDTAMIFFDGIIAALMVELEQTCETMGKRHATLE